MVQYLTNINLNKNELQNARIQNLAAAPENPVEGQIYYNTTDKTIYKWDGTAWTAMGSSYTLPEATASTLGGVKIGSGVTVASDGTISVDDFLPLNGGTMTGNIDMGANKIEGLPNPSLADDAATKGYVDSAIGGITEIDIVVVQPPLPATGVKGTIYLVPNSGTDPNVYDEYIWVEGTPGRFEKIGTTEVDLSNYLQLSGGTMSGNLNMGANKVTGLAAPTNNTDAANKSYVDTAVSGAIKTATGTIATTATSATVAYTGTLINAYTTQGGVKCVTDVAISATGVTFTCAQAPTTAIDCVVVYA